MNSRPSEQSHPDTGGRRYPYQGGHLSAADTKSRFEEVQSRQNFQTVRLKFNTENADAVPKEAMVKKVNADNAAWNEDDEFGFHQSYLPPASLPQADTFMQSQSYSVLPQPALPESQNYVQPVTALQESTAFQRFGHAASDYSVTETPDWLKPGGEELFLAEAMNTDPPSFPSQTAIRSDATFSMQQSDLFPGPDAQMEGVAQYPYTAGFGMPEPGTESHFPGDAMEEDGPSAPSQTSVGSYPMISAAHSDGHCGMNAVYTGERHNGQTYPWRLDAQPNEESRQSAKLSLEKLQYHQKMSNYHQGVLSGIRNETTTGDTL